MNGYPCDGPIWSGDELRPLPTAGKVFLADAVEWISRRRAAPLSQISHEITQRVVADDLKAWMRTKVGGEWSPILPGEWEDWRKYGELPHVFSRCALESHGNTLWSGRWWIYLSAEDLERGFPVPTELPAESVLAREGRLIDALKDEMKSVGVLTQARGEEIARVGAFDVARPRVRRLVKEITAKETRGPIPGALKLRRQFRQAAAQ